MSWISCNKIVLDEEKSRKASRNEKIQEAFMSELQFMYIGYTWLKSHSSSARWPFSNLYQACDNQNQTLSSIHFVLNDRFAFADLLA